MGVELVRKHVSDPLRRCYRSACRHPLLTFMLFMLIWTYRSFPALFSVLLHASPVIASTLILLGTLLFYGHANAPQIQIQTSHTHDIHNLVFQGTENTETDDETDSKLGNRRPLMANRGQFQPFRAGNSYKLKSSDGSRRNSFDLLGHLDDDDNKGWETGSDVGGGSSASVSVADTFPMLDEFHALLRSGEIVNETDDDDDVDDDDDHDMEDENGMTWTEDDHRNLMNMGTLEMERSQRLESLIARQKAIVNMRMQAEKNMANMSPDMMPRRKSFDFPYDQLGRKTNPTGPAFQSDSIGLHTNRRRGSDVGIAGYSALGLYALPRRIASDTESVGSTRASDVRPHQAANERRNEVKTSGGNTGNTEGYEVKTYQKSNSSTFFDVPDGIHDGDGDKNNEKQEFSAVDNSNSDSKDLQEEDEEEDDDDDDDSGDSDSEEGGLVERLKSWLTGW